LTPEAVPSLNLPVRASDRPRHPERRPNRAQNKEDRPLALAFPKSLLEVLPAGEEQPSTSSMEIPDQELNLTEDDNEASSNRVPLLMADVCTFCSLITVLSSDRMS
ncbi:hypothetical protein MTO96_044898, partial [Rhipicephalus appendiculatus]